MWQIGCLGRALRVMKTLASARSQLILVNLHSKSFGLNSTAYHCFVAPYGKCST
jgi:hypothetical protein